MNNCGLQIFLYMYILILSLEMRINNVELYTENSMDSDKGSDGQFIVQDN